jgi:glycosyltransferase involved in cell wall biosynthesis
MSIAPPDAAPPGKVLIVVENLSVPFDRRVWRECQALREAGYQVSTISPMGQGRDAAWFEDIEGVSVFRYPIRQASGSFASYVFEFVNAVAMTWLLSWVVLFRRGFDVIQICNPPDVMIFPVLPFKLLGKKIVFDQHDLCPEIYESQKGLHGRPSVVVKALLALELLTYMCCDAVMVVNESCRSIALGRGRRRAQDVFVVRNGPPLQNLQRGKADDRLKRGKPHLLTFVGMMGPQDGVDVMLRAIRKLWHEQRRRDFHVLVLGGGTVLGQMREYAEELGLAECVTFTGSVEYARVMEAIATADLCLCPDPKTPLSDKCSLMKTVEYMGLGRGFVAFDLEEVRLAAGSAAEYAKPGDEADFASRIAALLDDPERRTAMGQLGREQVLRGLTWEHSKQALLAAYDHALGRRPSVVDARAG